MPDCVALLRGINVGGHKVITMDALRRLFEALPLADVTTYIQSGNVRFRSRKGEAALRTELERHLHRELGYAVTVILRTREQLAALVAADPFMDRAFGCEEGTHLYVAFLPEPPAPEAARRVEATSSAIDVYRVRGREVLVACHKHLGESRFSGSSLERTLGQPATVRNWNVVCALASAAPAGGQDVRRPCRRPQ